MLPYYAADALRLAAGWLIESLSSSYEFRYNSNFKFACYMFPYRLDYIIILVD